MEAEGEKEADGGGEAHAARAEDGRRAAALAGGAETCRRTRLRPVRRSLAGMAMAEAAAAEGQTAFGFRTLIAFAEADRVGAGSRVCVVRACPRPASSSPSSSSSRTAHDSRHLPSPETPRRALAANDLERRREGDR